MHKRCLCEMRWRQIKSEHEEGADAKAQNRRAGDSAVWRLPNRANNASDVHRSRVTIEVGFLKEEKEKKVLLFREEFWTL